MNRKNIKIYIGSSLEELKKERTDLGVFFTGFSKEIEKKEGIHFESPFLYEYQSVKMNPDGSSQEMINNYIENESDICIFMFDRKIGEYTKQELDVAVKALEKPDIYIYFKDYQEGTDAAVLADEIFKNYGYYWGKFTYSDSITLRVLFDLLDGEHKFEIFDGKLYVDEHPIENLDIQKVDAYRNNEDYQALKKNIEEINVKISEAEQAEGNNSYALHQLKKECLKLETEQEEQEKHILELLKDLYPKVRKPNPEELNREILDLVNQGKVKEANDLLTTEMVISDAQIFKEHEDLLKKEGRDVISKATTKIKVLYLSLHEPTRFEQIEQIYNECWKIAADTEDFVFLTWCIRYYNEQKSNQEKCIEILDYAVSRTRDDKVLIQYCDLYSSVYIAMGILDAAIDKINQGMEIFRHLEKTDHQKDILKRCQVCSNLIAVYLQKQNYDVAEEYAQQLIGLVASLDKDSYEEDIAAYYNNIGSYYLQKYQSDNSEHYHKNGIDYLRMASSIIENYYGIEPEYHYGVNLAIMYEQQAKLCDYQEAKDLYARATGILEEECKNNSERFGESLFITYLDEAAFYMNRIHSGQSDTEYAVANEILGKAMDLLAKLIDAEGNKLRYCYDYYLLYRYYAELFSANEDCPKDDLIFLIDRALLALNTLYQNNPEKFAIELAEAYLEAAETCILTQTKRGSRSVFNKIVDYTSTAIEILESISWQDSGRETLGDVYMVCEYIVESYKSIGDKNRVKYWQDKLRKLKKINTTQS